MGDLLKLRDCLAERCAAIIGHGQLELQKSVPPRTAQF
jgi:hypothetical protein